MAAAVYLHNAIFGQPSRSNDHVSAGHDEIRDNSEEEESSDGLEYVEDNANDIPLETPHLDLGSSRAPSTSSPFSIACTHSNSNSQSTTLQFNAYADPTSRSPPNTTPHPYSTNVPPYSINPPVRTARTSTDVPHSPSNMTPHSPISPSNDDVDGPPDGHDRRISESSQTTLVHASPLPWSQVQARDRARYYARGSSVYQPTPTPSHSGSSSRGRSAEREGSRGRRSTEGRRGIRGNGRWSGERGGRRMAEMDVEDSDDLQPIDLSTDTDTNTAPVPVYTSVIHHRDRQDHDPNNRDPNSSRHPRDTRNPDADEVGEGERDSFNPSPLPPPGLASTTSRTSEMRPLTPYPWPVISPITDSNDPDPDLVQEKRKSGPHSRGRRKGRRRGDQEDPLATRASHLSIDPSHPSAPHPPTSISNQRTSSYFDKRNHRYLRKGRIPNIALSRTARISILTTRFLLGVLLGAWAAYMCARYWLAYSEFRPDTVPDSTNTAAPAAVEDPPRSKYAFVLAITCTIAVALLVLDSSYFLYFVLYPHDGRLLNRIPTIDPILRTNNERAAVDDAADDTDPASPPPRPRPPPWHQASIQLQDDKFTSMPYRSSVLSTSSGFKRSRRLSKPRPDSFLATYPPVGREVHHASGEDNAVREQAVNADTDEQEDANTRPSRPHEQERRTVVPPQESVIPPPPSRYVGLAPSTAPEDESDPQVEKHSKRTYTLHLPSLCHESSISPLPFPPTGITSTQRDSTQHEATRRSSWKWRRTRMFLHVVHWLTFVSLNIPGFVNVGLVPVWYQPTQASDVTGVNSPHRLSGLCEYSVDAIWAGTALPPSRPPPCAQTIQYKVWLWGAIGRVLVTFALSGLWIIMDGVWWGAWVVGTRNIGWQGALGCPWGPRRPLRSEQQQTPEDGSEGLPSGEIKETAWAKRIRLLSGASKASGKSGKSNKEKIGEFGARTPPNERGSSVAPVAAASVAIGAAAIGVTGGITNFGVDPQDAPSSPASKHRVRRKPVKPITPPSPSSNSPPAATHSLNSPPPSSTYGPGGKLSYVEQSRMAGGIGSRRPSTQDSIGGSTVVGSPRGNTTYLPGSPVFTPASPPASFPYQGSASIEEHPGFGNAARRSIALEIVPELEPRSSDERESPPDEQSPELERRYPGRPQSRLARYGDAALFEAQYRDRPGPHSSPASPTYPLSSTRAGWTADLNAFSPVTSPNADAALLDRGYFMIGDGGFSAGDANGGAYDVDSYYRAMSTTEEQTTRLSNQAGSSGANRATSPNSERSNSPISYGHGHYAGVDVRVETPTNGGHDDYSPEVPGLIPAAQGQWYTPSTSQHPLRLGIQMAMGHPPEFEREIRMLGSVVRRMSTIESFGSHERELSRRGSAATARTTHTGRGNSGGTTQREGTNGSGTSVPMNALAMTNSSGSGCGDRSGGSGSGGHAERNPEAEATVGFVRATSPTDMSPV